MQILTGQGFASAGRLEVFGAAPYENAAVLSRVCFVKESQRYPDNFKVHHALRAAALLFPRLDAAFAATLVDDFGLPTGRYVKKLCRGMLSALGVVIGLASRAELPRSTSRTWAWTPSPGTCSTTGCWPTTPRTRGVHPGAPARDGAERHAPGVLPRQYARRGR